MNDLQPAEFSQYARRTFYVFAVVLCTTLGMVGASFAPIPTSALRITLILGVACVNACIVAAFLMHLISERGLIRVVLVFTGIFFIALLGLSAIAVHDIPAVGTH